MEALNLPAYEYKITLGDDGITRIYDRLRKKYVALTPEEWVRQHFVNFLITGRGFPEGLMANEVTLKLNGTTRRCDSLVCDRYGRPLAVIEYKEPDVAISQAVFDQIARYNSVIGAPWVIVSNGINHYCCRFDSAGATYRFLPDIPSYDQL